METSWFACYWWFWIEPSYSWIRLSWTTFIFFRKVSYRWYLFIYLFVINLLDMLKAKETILTSLSCMIWKPLLQLFSSVEILLITPTFYVLEILSWYSQWCCFFNDDKEQISWDNKISWLFQQHFFRSRWQIWQSTTFTQQTKC